MAHGNHIYNLQPLVYLPVYGSHVQSQTMPNIHKVMHYPFLVLAHIAAANETHLFTDRVPGLRVTWVRLNASYQCVQTSSCFPH